MACKGLCDLPEAILSFQMVPTNPQQKYYMFETYLKLFESKIRLEEKCRLQRNCIPVTYPCFPPLAPVSGDKPQSFIYSSYVLQVLVFFRQQFRCYGRWSQISQFLAFGQIPAHYTPCPPAANLFQNDVIHKLSAIFTKGK